MVQRDSVLFEEAKMSLVNVTAVSVEDFDSMTLLLWSVMVFFMQAGFALYEGEHG